MTAQQRRPPSPYAALWTYGGILLGTVAAIIYIPAQLYARFFSESKHWITPANPFAVIPSVLRGQTPWTGSHTFFAVLVGLVLAFLGWLAMKAASSHARAREHINNKARLMGDGREMSLAATVKKVKDGALVTGDISPGFMLAKSVSKSAELWASWRDGICMLAGPGGGKTTAVAVPLVMDAPGAVFVTSNKRDICDIIRKAREALGRFWVFDPQRITDYQHGGPAPWYWNVLSFVTDETKARSLATLFAAHDKEEGAKSDPFFDKEGPALLARLMHAAALDGKYLDQVFVWLAKASFKEPITILKAAGFELSAEGVDGIYRIRTTDQGIGVIGTAMKSIQFLDNRIAVQWIKPTGPDDTRPQFDPAQFVRSKADTLVSLSKEGNDSFGPITAAMVMAVLDSAEEYAEREGGGRMPVPLLGLLDEAANICRIPTLPKKYSYYGSYGVFLVTILQNWSQGVLTWGEHGMSQLWSAATYGIVGAGIKDEKFLGSIAKGVGEYNAPQYTRSSSNGRNRHDSTSDSYRETQILTVADLQNMPPGTMVVSAMGARPVLARGVPYWKRGKVTAALCEESKQTYTPKQVVA